MSTFYVKNTLNTSMVSHLESCPFHFGSLQIWKPIWKLRLYELSWLWTVTNLWSALIVINGLQKQNNAIVNGFHLHLFDFPFINHKGSPTFTVSTTNSTCTNSTRTNFQKSLLKYGFCKKLLWLNKPRTSTRFGN